MPVNKPQQQILTVWRIRLALIALVPAFATSFFLRMGSIPWIITTGVWILLFFLIYLVYFPLLYKSISYGVSGGKLVLRMGVLYSRVIAVPLSHIQFTVVAGSFLSRLFGLSSVIISAPGARMAVHGLKAPDAEALAELIKH